MSKVGFVLCGAGFWARYQLAAWHEIPGARCVAVVDRNIAKARELAERFSIQTFDDDLDRCLSENRVDFVDLVTGVDSHAPLAAIGARHGLPVICQKPLAPSLNIATEMVRTSEQSGTKLYVHENWRWQTPLRGLKEKLRDDQFGKLTRARIDFASSFPVFDNQPFLKTLDQFILTDVGTHILDAARFLFGEAEHLSCQTRKMRDDIAGEDVATVMLKMRSGLTVTCNMSYASRWQYDCFPETVVAVEGTRAGVTLAPNHQLTMYGHDGSETKTLRPVSYKWADPAYDLIHSSIVDCHRNLFDAICERGDAETTAQDNLKTLRLVFAAYESAEHQCVVRIDP